MVSVFLALAGVNGLDGDEAYRREIATPEDLAGYLATIENGQSFGALTGDGGVGTFGGSEDHTAMLCCRAGQLSQYAFCPVRRERQVPCPPGRRFVVAVSGVRAEKTGAAKDAYNRASLAVRAILGRCGVPRRAGRTSRWPSAVARAGRGRGARARSNVPPIDGFTTSALLDRFDQFVDESTEIIPAAADALTAGDTARFGALVDEVAGRWPSGASATRCPRRWRWPGSRGNCGAEAASAFGAGFGGSVWALVPDEIVEKFARDWEGAYRRAFPRAEPSFLVTRAGAAASRI